MSEHIFLLLLGITCQPHWGLQKPVDLSNCDGHGHDAMESTLAEVGSVHELAYEGLSNDYLRIIQNLSKSSMF